MKKIFVGIGIVFLIIIIGGSYYMGTKSSEKDLKTVQDALTAANAPRVGDASPSPAVHSTVVTIKKGAFDPTVVTVKKGEEVVWMNTDAVAHTVTSDEGGTVLNSQLIAAGHAFAHVFTEAGTVTYHCAIDRAMKGTIIVN